MTQSIETWAKFDKHFSVLKNSNRTRQILSISSLALEGNFQTDHFISDLVILI